MHARPDWTCWVPVAPGDVRARLDGALRRGTFVGAVRDGFTFRLANTPYAPRLEGKLLGGEGTLVEVRVTLDPLARLLAPLGWAPATFATTHAVGRSTSALADALGAAAFGDDAQMRADRVGDPTAPGAASAAPRSFGVTATHDSARFVVVGQGSQATFLEVSASGLAVGARRVSWDDLASVQAADGALVLATPSGPVRVLAREHAPWEVRWLAAFLEARRRRMSASAADRAEAAEDLAALKALTDRER